MAGKKKVKLFHPKEVTRMRCMKKQYDATYVYACNACPRRYKEKKYLNFHITTMLRKKIFQCDNCSEIFFRKYHLARHLSKHCPVSRPHEKKTQTQIEKENPIDPVEFNRTNRCFVKLRRITENSTEAVEKGCTTDDMSYLANNFEMEQDVSNVTTVVDVGQKRYKDTQADTITVDKSTQTDEPTPTGERKGNRKRRGGQIDIFSLTTKKKKKPGNKFVAVASNPDQGNLWANYGLSNGTVRTKAQRKDFGEPSQAIDADETIVVKNQVIEKPFVERDNEALPFEVSPENAWIVHCDSLNEFVDLDKTCAMDNLIGNGKRIAEICNLDVLKKRINRAATIEKQIDTYSCEANMTSESEKAASTSIIHSESSDDCIDVENIRVLENSILNEVSIVNKLPNSKLKERFRNEIIEDRSFKCITADGTTTEQCPFCEIEIAAGVSEWITHFKHHTGELQLDCTSEQRPDLLYGFMCPGCFHTQLNRQRLIDHIHDEHKIKGDLWHACIKFKLLQTTGISQAKIDRPIHEQLEVFRDEDREEGEISSSDDDRFEIVPSTTNLEATSLKGNSGDADNSEGRILGQTAVFSSRYSIRPFLKNSAMDFKIKLIVQ